MEQENLHKVKVVLPSQSVGKMVGLRSNSLLQSTHMKGSRFTWLEGWSDLDRMRVNNEVILGVPKWFGRSGGWCSF